MFPKAEKAKVDIAQLGAQMSKRKLGHRTGLDRTRNRVSGVTDGIYGITVSAFGCSG